MDVRINPHRRYPLRRDLGKRAADAAVEPARQAQDEPPPAAKAAPRAWGVVDNDIEWVEVIPVSRARMGGWNAAEVISIANKLCPARA